jgi:hypothetical protein
MATINEESDVPKGIQPLKYLSQIMTNAPEGSLTFMDGHGHKKGMNILNKIDVSDEVMAQVLYERAVIQNENGYKEYDTIFLGGCYSTDYILNIHNKLQQKLASNNMEARFILMSSTERSNVSYMDKHPKKDEVSFNNKVFVPGKLGETTYGTIMENQSESIRGNLTMFIINGKEITQIAKAQNSIQDDSALV